LEASTAEVGPPSIASARTESEISSAAAAVPSHPDTPSFST
jgi:hypothetical protein